MRSSAWSQEEIVPVLATLATCPEVDLAIDTVEKITKSIQDVSSLANKTSQSTKTKPQTVPQSTIFTVCGEDAILTLLTASKTTLQTLTTRSKITANPPSLSDDEDSISNCDILINLARAKFYEGHYEDVNPCWRMLYTDASIIKACALAARLGAVEDVAGSPVLDEVVRALDLAIIMAGAAGVGRRDWIEGIFELLSVVVDASDAIDHSFVAPQAHEADFHEPAAKRRRVSGEACNAKAQSAPQDRFPTQETFRPPVSRGIPRLQRVSMLKFMARNDKPADPAVGTTPLIITGTMTQWPAISSNAWSRPSYFLEKTLGGRRLVPVELGRSYTDEGWGQRIITFKEFMHNYLLEMGGGAETARVPKQPTARTAERAGVDMEIETLEALPIAYLAQHDLFAQIPSLRNDILIPEYCHTIPPRPHPSSPLAKTHSALRELDSPIINAWFGPAETISPLHVDPYHNILCQVVGQKYIRLYAARETAKLQPRGVDALGINMGNTSSIDVGLMEGWDGTDEERRLALEACPEWCDVAYVDCVLEAGEMLYIPVGWWHYVRSLSLSFSVSFWWN